jgi:aryl-alcohol dehydrogenase-like predicted oxidoreductase
MQMRTLGSSGLKVTVVGVGCNNFGMRIDADATKAVVDAALDAGINLFDTADVYGGGQSEEFLGRALGPRRSDVVIATKFRSPMGGTPNDQGGSRAYVMRAVEASLRRLGTDWIDLYQMHFPDPETPIEETLSALDDLVRQGKVRYIGSSNFAGWQIADADWVARTQHMTPFVTAQNHYSFLERNVEREVIPACARFGIGMLPYFPLASGMLTGKYSRGEAPPEGTRLALMGQRGERFMAEKNFDVVEGLEKVAADRGISLLHVAIGGLAAQPQVVSVIAGATKPEQIKANVEAGSWTPSADDLAAIDAVVPSKRPEI